MYDVYSYISIKCYIFVMTNDDIQHILLSNSAKVDSRTIYYVTKKFS